MNRLPGLFLALLLTLAGSQVILRLAALELSRRVHSEEALTQAIEFDDTNPDLFSQRAELLLNDLRFQSYQRAGQDLLRATRLNPHYWRYWSDLARFQERTQDWENAEQSFRKAIRLSPRNGLYHWALFNFLLRQGRTEEALDELRPALEFDEELRDPGLDLLLQLGLEPVRLLEIWPADRRSTLFLIHTLSQRPDPDEVRDRTLRLLFDHLLELEPLPIQELFGLVRYWQDRLPEEARRVWGRYQAKLGADGAEYADGTDLIWNGGFEDPISSGGLGWSIERPDSVLLDRVQGQGYESTTGLRVRIDGRNRTESGALAEQYPLVPPGRYLLSCRFRSDDNKADGRIQLSYLELSSGSGVNLEMEARSNAQWTTVEVPLTVSSWSLVRLQLHAGLSRTGAPVTFWLDDIRLSPVRE